MRSKVWFKCPKCGTRFERYGDNLDDIEFGVCSNCGYKEKKNIFKSLLEKFKKNK